MSAPTYTQLDVTKWQYTEPKRNPKNGWNVFLHDQNKRNPRMQLDKCRVPFGVQDNLEDTSSTRKNLELSITNAGFQAWASTLDAQNIKWVTDNSMAVFKKEMKQATVEALYRSMLTPHKGDYPPLLRVKVNASGRQATQVFVVEDEGNGSTPLKYRPGTVDDVSPHSEVLPIVEVVGLWFIAKGFGMTLLATDLLVFPAPKRGGFHFALPQPAVQCSAGSVISATLPDPEPSVLNAPTIVQSAITADTTSADDNGEPQ